MQQYNLDKIKCKITYKDEILDKAKCYGYRYDNNKYEKMAIVEIKNPSKDIINASLYCLENNEFLQYYDIIKDYKNGKIIELTGYYAIEPFLSDKKSKGLPPKIFKALLFNKNLFSFANLALSIK